MCTQTCQNSFLFETKEISDDYMFVRETTSLFNIGEWEAQLLYLMLMYNSNHTGNNSSTPKTHLTPR